MKNKRFFRKFLVLAAVMFSMTAFSVTAYAGGGEAVEPPPAETPPPQTETTPEPVPLTPEGNLSLVDDIESAGSEDKQFITVTSKSGNTFYIIIDRAADGKNYFGQGRHCLLHYQMDIFKKTMAENKKNNNSLRNSYNKHLHIHILHILINGLFVILL